MDDEWSGELVGCEWWGEPIHSGDGVRRWLPYHRSDHDRRATAEVVSVMAPAARPRDRRALLNQVGAEQRRRAALKLRYKAALGVVRGLSVEERYALMYAVLWPPRELRDIEASLSTRRKK
jgi:hypothetical protein